MSFSTFSRFTTIAVVGGLLFANACAAPVDVTDPGESGTTDAAAVTGKTSSALGDYPMACKCTWFGNQNNCDESLTEKGANRCSSDCDCSAGRKCNSTGWCEGIADAERCQCDYGYQRRECNEAVNKDGANRCSSDCDCAEGRKCSSQGYCTGHAHGPTTCEETCQSEYAACRLGCGQIPGTKTYCLTTCATLFAECANRCPKE